MPIDVFTVTEFSETELRSWARRKMGFAADGWRASDGLWFVAWGRNMGQSEASSIQSVAMFRALQSWRESQREFDAHTAEAISRI